DKKKDVPKLLSIISNRTAANSAGKETTPTIAVIKNAQMVRGNLVMDIPIVLILIVVAIKLSDPINEEAMKMAIEINHRVIPIPEPGWAIGRALNGGYMVHPAAAGPASKNKELTIIILDKKNNQYATMFKNGEAISLAPICKGIKRLLKVPLSPAVNTKNTIMVP